MKQLLIVMFVATMAVAGAQEQPFYPTTPPVLQWDEPENALLPGDTVAYEVFIWDRLNGEIDQQPIASLPVAGETALSELVLDFPYRAAWQVGVRLKHTDGGGNVSYSQPIYSSVAEDCLTGIPFSYIPGTVWFPVDDPSDLHDSTIAP